LEYRRISLHREVGGIVARVFESLKAAKAVLDRISFLIENLTDVAVGLIDEPVRATNLVDN